MQIFQGSEADLKTKFGLAPMAVVWVGILQSKGVFLTEPVLELCRPGGVLEPLIKDRSLLIAIGQPVEFANLQVKYDKERLFPLAIVTQDSRRILALEDELLAESGWQQPATAGPSGSNAAATLPALLSQGVALAKPDAILQGLEELFSKEEVAKLKMVIATAVKPDEKIEAIRKMALSQVSVREKGILLLHALGDTHTDVRQEAGYGLRQIGCQEGVAEAIDNLCSGDHQQREYAINSLALLFAGASEIEKGAILQLLLSLLRDKEYRPQVPHILATLAQFVAQIPPNPVLWNRLLMAGMESLVSMFDEVIVPASQLMKAIMAQAPQEVAAFLQIEIAKTGGRRLRGLLLTLLAETGPADGKKQEIARQMAMEIGLGDELDPVYWRLLDTLTKLGDIAVSALLERFACSIRITEKIQVIELLDQIFHEQQLAAEHKNQALRHYTQAFPTAINPVRLAILDCDLLEDPAVAPELKTAFVTEALVDLHRDRLDQFYSAVQAALRRIRLPAIAPLLATIRNPLHTQQACRAAYILGEISLLLLPEESEQLVQIKALCMEQLQTTPPCRGELFKVLGKVAASPAANTQFTEEIGNYLVDNLCKTAHPYEVLEGLGFAAASRFTKPEFQTDIGYLFTALMDKRLPENLAREKEVAGETVFEFTFQTNAYTDLLPVLIFGLGRIVTSPNTLVSLRQRIIHYFLKKWADLVAYRVVWGPKNITDLAQIMRDIAIHQAIALEDKLLLTRALFQKQDVFSITELLASIFQVQSGDDFGELAAQLAHYLLEAYQSEEYQRMEDREVLLRCMSQLAQASKLHRDGNVSENIRERLVYAIFDGLREDIFGTRGLLENLQKSDRLPAKLCQEIQKRVPK